MNIYLIFILFGIIIFLLLNKYNNFSIGNQFSLYNKPCRCSDEFNMPFQTNDDCLYIDDDEVFETTGERGERRYGRFNTPCDWSGNSNLITRMQPDTVVNLYLNDTKERFAQCREQYTSGGMCALVNGIEYYCYLIGVPVNNSDIDYMVELNIGGENDRPLTEGNQQLIKLNESVCKIFLKNEGISILKRDKLMPIMLEFDSDLTNLLVNKYYYCRWRYTSDVFDSEAHDLTIYHFMEDDLHKIVILDTYWTDTFVKYGLENTILEMNDLSLASMKIMAFYLKFNCFLLLSNNIIFMRNRITLLDTGILCKVIDEIGILVTRGSSLDSDQLLTLASGVKFKVKERRDVQNKIRMRITSRLNNGIEEKLDGWVTLTVFNSNNFKFIPDDYFTNIDYDRSIVRLVNSQVAFKHFLTCEKFFRDNIYKTINNSYMDQEYFRLVQPLQSNPLFQINDEVEVQIQKNYLLLSVSSEYVVPILKVYFGDFALSTFKCDSFTLPGSSIEILPIENNHIVMRIYRYTHIKLTGDSSPQDIYEFYYDPLTLHIYVPNTIRDLLKVQKMYASIGIYEEYLTENRLLHDLTNACSVFFENDAG
jgi:hypothetical protein